MKIEVIQAPVPPPPPKTYIITLREEEYEILQVVAMNICGPYATDLSQLHIHLKDTRVAPPIVRDFLRQLGSK